MRLLILSLCVSLCLSLDWTRQIGCIGTCRLVGAELLARCGPSRVVPDILLLSSSLSSLSSWSFPFSLPLCRSVRFSPLASFVLFFFLSSSSLWFVRPSLLVSFLEGTTSDSILAHWTLSITGIQWIHANPFLYWRTDLHVSIGHCQ